MITALRGMKDLFGNDAKLYEYIIKVSSKIAKNYGYEFCEMPKLEATNLFKRSVGESSDIVGKEMYEFLDKSGNEVCLRPEGTAGVVRGFIEAKFDRVAKVRKFFYYGSMFRYERPQKGRLREFRQFGVECFGESSVYEDAALISLGVEILKELNIKHTLKINSLGSGLAMQNFKQNLVEFVKFKQENMCQDCQRRLVLNPMRILDCKNEACKEILKNAPKMIDNLSQEDRAEFELLCQILRENGIKFEIDHKLVRGLDYYCKSAFEFVSDEIGSQSAIIGGGRYDKLVEFLGGRPTFAVGFAIGVDRLMEILKNKEIKDEKKIYLCTLDERFLPEIFKISTRLRKFHNVEMSYDIKSFSKHLNFAIKGKFNTLLCIGEDEAKNGEILYKNLDENRQNLIKIENLEKEI